MIDNRATVRIKFIDQFWMQLETTSYINQFLKKYFTVFKTGAQFSKKYTEGGWDGCIQFYTQAGKLPIGLLKELLHFLDTNTLSYSFENNRSTLKPHYSEIPEDFLPNIKLRGYQIDAIHACLREGFGIVKIATGGGKTVVICGVLKAYQPKRAIIVAGQINLVMQLYDRMISYGFPADEIGLIWGGEQNYKGKRYIFSTIQSIMNFPELYKTADVLIIDECKHQQANTYSELSKKTSALVKLGFDATPFTGEDKAIDWTIKKSIGDVIYEKTTKELIDMGLLVRPIIGMLSVKNEDAKGVEWKAAYKEFVVNNNMRNEMIRKIAEKENGRILILVNHIDHGRELQHLIPNTTFLWGEVDSIERYEEIQNFINSHEKYVLIGSTIFDEGIDFEKGIDAIIIASAGKGFRKVVQRLGRALRPNQKGYVSVYDFYDEGNKYLTKHSEIRKNIYKSEGHTVSVV